MNKYKHSKASLFLMEIMVNILFFSILVTICLQLFFKAHNLSESTTTLHRAVTTSTSIAEIYQNGENEKEHILKIYPDAVIGDEQIMIFFTEEFASCPKEDGIYQALISIEDARMHNAVIEFMRMDTGSSIYSLSVSAYRPQTLSSLSGGGTNE